MSSNLSVTFTPTLMLGAITIAMRFAASAISAFCSSEKPVVPITRFTPCASQARRWSIVPSGRVKSIRHWLCDRPAATSAVMSTPEAYPACTPAS